MARRYSTPMAAAGKGFGAFRGIRLFALHAFNDSDVPIRAVTQRG